MRREKKTRSTISASKSAFIKKLYAVTETGGHTEPNEQFFSKWNYCFPISFPTFPSKRFTERRASAFSNTFYARKTKNEYKTVTIFSGIVKETCAPKLYWYYTVVLFTISNYQINNLANRISSYLCKQSGRFLRISYQIKILSYMHSITLRLYPLVSLFISFVSERDASYEKVKKYLALWDVTIFQMPFD